MTLWNRFRAALWERNYLRDWRNGVKLTGTMKRFPGEENSEYTERIKDLFEKQK